ncbi:MAG: DUF309 domain-containing protein [Polyangiaceae bacterium]
MPSTRAEREAAFQRGVLAYRSGLHYEAHELWEELWNDEDDDDNRQFLQALIQVTSAVHKLRNAVAPRGALTLLDRAIGRMRPLPEDHGGVALGVFRDASLALRLEAERRLAAGERGLPEALIPPLLGAQESAAWRQRPAEPPANRAGYLRLGVAAYQRGNFYEAHEHWETIWRQEDHATMKGFLQGLILVAAAMHKLDVQGSATGAARLFERADARLALAPEGTGGMSVRRLRDGIRAARASLATRQPGDDTPLPRELVPRLEPVAAAS